jgi:hypothetical protein
MPFDQTRRRLLGGGAVAALGALGVAAGVERATSESSSSPAHRSTIGVVTSTSRTHVQIAGSDAWFPIEGFQDGWRVLKGDKVSVLPSLEGDYLSAQPVSYWVSAFAPLADVVPGTQIGGAGGPEVLQATVFDHGILAQRGSREPMNLLVAVADRELDNGPLRAIAIRGA